MAGKQAPPKSPTTSPMDDLIPRRMLPEKPGIPAGKEFGANIPRRKAPAPKKMAKGGSASSASKRADGCATRGKTRGRMV